MSTESATARNASAGQPGARPRGSIAADAAMVLARERSRLLGLAYSILGDRDLAADTVQDTMEAALRSWASLRDPDRRGAWLSTICVRQSLRRARAERRQRLLRWRHDTEAASLAGVHDVDLERALRALSDKQRAVIALHYIYGCTLNESAKAMGCRPGTARSHLHRALASLRESLGGDRDDLDP